MPSLSFDEPSRRLRQLRRAPSLDRIPVEHRYLRTASNQRSQPATLLRDTATQPPRRLILCRWLSHQMFWSSCPRSIGVWVRERTRESWRFTSGHGKQAPKTRILERGDTRRRCRLPTVPGSWPLESGPRGVCNIVQRIPSHAALTGHASRRGATGRSMTRKERSSKRPDARSSRSCCAPVHGARTSRHAPLARR
jgi:hypothetical protein